MYEVLHFKGNKVAQAVPGEVLGENELFQPYRIIDAEYDPDTKLTTVYLQLSDYGE